MGFVHDVSNHIVAVVDVDDEVGAVDKRKEYVQDSFHRTNTHPSHLHNTEVAGVVVEVRLRLSLFQLAVR